MRFDTLLLLSTALSTGIALFAAWYAEKRRLTVVKTAQRLEKALARNDLLIETVDSIDQRLKRLAGKFYYERARGGPQAADLGTPDDDDVDPQFDALLALQQAHSPPGGQS